MFFVNLVVILLKSTPGPIRSGCYNNMSITDITIIIDITIIYLLLLHIFIIVTDIVIQ